MKTSKIVTLESYSSAMEANIVASMLQGMGISVQIVNEISSNMIPYLNDNAVRLLVSENDYEKAKEILSAKVEKD